MSHKQEDFLLPRCIHYVNITQTRTYLLGLRLLVADWIGAGCFGASWRVQQGVST